MASQSQPECAATPATAGSEPSAVWHPTLPIQINWTYAVHGSKAEVFCPGNAYPWRMARIEVADPEAAEAYARLITAAPDLLEACRRAEPWFLDGPNAATGNLIRAAIAKALGTSEPQS